MDTIRIEVSGNAYLWNGESWTDDRYMRPPASVRGQLMTRLVRQLVYGKLAELDVDLAVRVARACLEEGDLEDARSVARKAVKADPDHLAAVTLLAEILRKERLPRRAIKLTDEYARRRNTELLTVRAAAFADISDWDNAETFVRRALAIDKADASPETLQVMTRVLSARSREAA